VSVRFTKRSSRVRMLSHTSRTSHDAPRALRRARDVSPHSYRQLHAIADAQQPSMARKLTTLLSVTIDARVRQTLATYDRDAIMLVLRHSIGLTPQGAQALSTFEQGMLADGVAPGVAASRASSYAERLRRQRAETIARTETLNAANAGQQALWNEAGRVGLVDRARAWKEWIVTPDDRLCVLCEQMEGARVRVDDEFSTPRGSLEHPPMHPRCRCAMGLSFDPLDREGGA
jgi:SPP1 gp7 family putative phage head morphogenesis protein